MLVPRLFGLWAILASGRAIAGYWLITLNTSLHWSFRDRLEGWRSVPPKQEELSARLVVAWLALAFSREHLGLLQSF
jgi:hypothetical protein